MKPRHYMALKRALDVAAVAATSPLWLAALAAVALAVRVSMGSPVLFRQKRAGRAGRVFTILKFRTMRDGPEPDAERITPLGRFLRRTSLDELPQMLNVLRGDMSVVGPRPLLPEYLPLYTERQSRRHDVLPGLTGWAQVNGRNAVSWEEKLELDAFYAENAGPFIDAVIVLRTLAALALAPFRHRREEELVMPPFKGRGKVENGETKV